MPRLIDANAIPWEEYYVPDPDRDAQWDFKKEWAVNKPVIDQMPTVDAVEVVHGEWGEIYTCHGERLWGYKCSQCEQDNPNKSNYCPNCGAKMDGDGNDI